MAGEVQAILAKANQEKDLLTAIAGVINDLKANQNDPVALQAIVTQMDANIVAENVLAGTAAVSPPPTP